MNKEEFVESIKSVVISDSIKSVEANLLLPRGKAPRQEMLEMSKWFNVLNSSDKSMLMKIIRESIETSVFGFFCVLDGVRSIENDNEKGSLELYYKKAENRVLLNDPDEEYLHDLL